MRLVRVERIVDDLRAERCRQRITCREMGQRLGVSHAAISDFERGKTRPTLDYLTGYASALGGRIEVRFVKDGEVKQ